jgi:hypothetical protein
MCGASIPATSGLNSTNIAGSTPLRGPTWSAGIGKPVVLSPLVPEHELLESRFYREWVRPQDLIDRLHVTVDKEGTTLALFAVSRRKRDGVADKQAFQRMQLLAPHLRRAVLVAKVMGTTQAQASALAETFDELRAGMFLVDRNGRGNTKQRRCR